jgi:methionyl-tRNA formyltransferase
MFEISAPKIDRSFTEIRWDTMSARQIDQLFRSVYTFKPLLTTFNAELVKIYELSADDSEDAETPRPAGTMEYNKSKNCLLVSCAGRQRVSIFKLSIGKKKAMSAADFYNGFLSKVPVEARCFNKSF